MKHTSEKFFLRFKAAIGVNQWTKCCFNELPFRTHKNEFGRIRNGREIKSPYVYSLFIYIFILFLAITSQKWSQSQLDQKLLSCGDVESNPGPEFLDKGSLKCIQINCNGWKSQELEKLLYDEKPDVVMIQETKLKEIKKCSVNGYVVFRRDRMTARGGENATVSGGGLVTLIKDDAASHTKFSIVEMSELDLGNDNVTEVLQVKLIYRNTGIIFSNIYRPPIWNHAGDQRVDHFEAENVLGRCLSSCSTSQHVIGGDFNAHYSVWDNITKDDHHGQEIYEWCIDAHMDLANNGSVTYMSTSNARKSTPDITMTSPGVIVDNWSTLKPISSDHLPITFNISIRNNGEEIRKRSTLRKTTIAWKKVDWVAYNLRVRENIQHYPNRGASSEEIYQWFNNGGANNMHNRSKRLNAALVLATKILPRGCRYDPVPWWHDEIDDAVVIRDLLREEASLCEQNRVEWINACQEVTAIIKMKRLEYLRDFYTKVTYTANPGKVAAVIKSINRDPRASTNIAIVTNNGKLLHGDFEKATAFRGEFAKVTGNVHDEETRSRQYRVEKRKEKIEMHKYVNTTSYSPQASPFSSTELEAQLQRLDLKRAPGEDGIHNEMLINLEDDIKAELLTVINMSWATGDSPASWLCGVIIPIHKSGKDKVFLSSYRPVCLMSVVAKFAECLITCRLRYDLESRGILTPNQSGFRTGRSTADPLLRLISDIQEGMNKPAPAQRTVAALIDLSRAFDKVKHCKLLLESKKLGIDSCYAKWYQGFLTHRMYRVRYGEEVSKYCRFANGVPQGSVSGPLLFIIFINSLSVLLSELESEGLKHHLLADDTTIWNTNSDISSIAIVIQKGLDIILGWCKKYRMYINFGKNEGILFTNNQGDHAVEFRIALGEDIIPLKQHVRLLGLILDSKLNFNEHVQKIKKICHFRQNQLSAIAGYRWGGHTKDNRAAFFAFVHSHLIHNSAIFYPLLSANSMQTLQKIQNRGARVITGLLKATRIEDLLMEANLYPLKIYYEAQCANAAEKARRMPFGDPLHTIASGALPPSRLVKTGKTWQQVSNKIFDDLHWRIGRINANGNEIPGVGGNYTDKLSIKHRVPVTLDSNTPPWACQNATKIKFITNLITPCVHSDSIEVWKKATDDTISAHGEKNIEMFTDGSVIDKLGAGAADIYERKDIGQDKLYRVVAPAGPLCSSFKAEIVGVQCGLDKLIDTDIILKEGKSLIICTDSQSLVSKLKKGPITQKIKPCATIWSSLLTLVGQCGITDVIFQYIKGHVGVLKNEKVDASVGKALQRYNKEKLGFSQKKSPILLQGIKAEVQLYLIREYKNTLSITHPRYLTCGNIPSDLKLSATYSRADEVLLHQLRSGECKLMGRHEFMIKKRISPSCRWCQLVDETVIHVFSDCLSPNIVQLKLELNFQDVTVLHKAPLLGLKFCRDAINIL